MTQYAYLPSPKPSFKRRTPKRANRGKFSPKTIQRIFERDGWRCVHCGASTDLERVPHHIEFKSQGGRGTEDNGATVCRTCHRWAHSCREGCEWFKAFGEKLREISK